MRAHTDHVWEVIHFILLGSERKGEEGAGVGKEDRKCFFHIFIVQNQTIYTKSEILSPLHNRTLRLPKRLDIILLSVR